jgi:hypothetical protein
VTKKRSDGAGRRRFLKEAGLATAGAVLGSGVAGRAGEATPPQGGLSILVAPADEIAAAPPSRWAIEELKGALSGHAIPSRVISRPDEAARGDLLVVACGRGAAPARDVALADSPEAFAIRRGRIGERAAILVRASDVRGFVYALTELADVVALSADPLTVLAALEPIAAQPANAVRSCMRMFCSDVEDKPWFRDRDFWRAYLSMLVAQRFNRINLSFGLGYDFTTEIRDAYLHFAYPFLLKVPGHAVVATNLSDVERDRNLEMLRFISDEAASRGLHFQLGLWTHAYEWTNSPDANHRIEGLTPRTQGPYCRDALAILLKECPGIAGVTIRTHGESGVSEGNYDVWRMVFDGAVRSGRRVEIDLHAKGLDQKMIDAALATGLPVVVSPKFWAEHMGLPYHQAWIRPTELPQREEGEGLFARSSGARSFLRYGYGDLLDEGRRYGIVHRIWPGTQRLLVWGDPVFAAAYGREASFCGTQGAELMEPLSFKGRKGSGQVGPRTAYADRSLVPRHDFQKYLYTYRLWGRLLYDPDAPPETWRRLLRSDHGRAAPAVEAALAASSRILPLMTTAHAPSAANNHWWLEMPAHMSIVDASHPEPYTDTPEPKRFGPVSPLDPQLFASVDDCAGEILSGRPGGRYDVAEVAAALEDLAATAAGHLAEARGETDDVAQPAFRRPFVDTGAVIGLGRFFAARLRTALLYALFDRTGDRRILDQALSTYDAARAAWGEVVAGTRGVYVKDVSYGIAWYQRGHWGDRTAALDQDRAAMERMRAAAGADRPSDRFRELIDAVLHPPTRAAARLRHAPPPSFRRGEPLPIEVTATGPVSSVTLHFRHTNQAEPWRSEALSADADVHRGVIAADYTDSVYPLQYYFECVGRPGSRPVLFPGFDADWSNQPYFALRPLGASGRADR